MYSLMRRSSGAAAMFMFREAMVILSNESELVSTSI